MPDLVIVKDDELLVSTWDLSKGFQSEHRQIKRLIDDNLADFEEVGERKIESERSLILRFQNAKSNVKKSGRPVIEYFLNETQSTYLITLLRNNDVVKKFKKHLTKEFFRQRKLLNKLITQRVNAEWLEKRAAGKIERRIETDKIKEFIEYAKGQGSESAGQYYTTISRMENESLINIEVLEMRFKNVREIVDGLSLDMLKMADIIVGNSLTEGMLSNMFYRDIYKLARDRVEAYSLLMGKKPKRLGTSSKLSNQLLIS